MKSTYLAIVCNVRVDFVSILLLMSSNSIMNIYIYNIKFHTPKPLLILNISLIGRILQTFDPYTKPITCPTTNPFTYVRDCFTLKPSLILN